MQNVTDTRQKLLEVNYFLEQMKNTQSSRDAFKYNLSAFLSAARSVTFVMQSEFRRVSGFNDWYSQKQVETEGDDLMKFLKDKRNITVKQEPVRPRALVSVTNNEPPIIINDHMSFVIKRASGTVERSESIPPRPQPQPKAQAQTTVEWLWYFVELPDKDVVSVCAEHVTKLESLVTECESRFHN